MNLLGIAFSVLAFVCAGAFGVGFGTDATKVFAEAKREKKPVIVSFFGIWCPPCNQLDETVFETKPFLQKSKAFKLLKVDADDKKSWAIKNKYKVGGYPTVVFADPNGEEIYRIVGYRTLKEFLRVMDIVVAAKGKSLAKACESSTVDDLWRCVVICNERGDHECREKTLSKLEGKLTKGSLRYEQARAFATESAKTEDLKREGYARLLAEFPQSPLSLGWALEYLKTFDGQTASQPKKDLVDKTVGEFDTIKKDPRLEEAGYSVTDLLELKAELLERMDQVAAAKLVWKQASTELEAQAAQMKGPARGFALERIGCLEAAGESESALKLANEYRSQFPGEFTFHFRAARILAQSKKFSEAEPVAKKAYETSYGDNRIRVATLLMDIYGPLADKKSAQKIYDDVKKEIKPDEKMEVRTHRYLKALDEAWKKAQATATT